MITVSKQLRELIDDARPRLLSITEKRAGEKPIADKWSVKEILGHMTDSAANNHQRIVRMQERADIGNFQYTQNHWVTSQHYDAIPWPEEVEFWYCFNAHLAHIIAHIDPKTLGHTCDMGYDKTATLKFVAEDYVRHQKHHLDQIFGGADPRNRAQWERRTPA